MDQLKDLTENNIEQLVPKIGDQIRLKKFIQEYIRVKENEIPPSSGIMLIIIMLILFSKNRLIYAIYCYNTQEEEK